MTDLSAEELSILKSIDDVPVHLIDDNEKKIINELINKGLVIIKELGKGNFFYFITPKAEKLIGSEYLLE